MPIGYFFVHYKRRDLGSLEVARYCAMQDVHDAIRADGGDQAEVEVLHLATPSVGDTAGKAIVRVRASIAILADLATVYRRLPKNALDDPLSDLTPAQRSALRGELEDCGYTLVEIQARFGNRIQDFTLRDVVMFAASRRRKPRYDAANNRIFCDGIAQTCRDIADLERRCFGDADWMRLKSLRDALLTEWDAQRQVIRLAHHSLTAGLPKHERDALLVLCGQAGYAYDRVSPGTFPTTGVLDNFNRADGPLGSAWTAPLWGTDTALQVATNRVNRTSANQSMYWNAGTFTDSEVYLDIQTMPNDTTVVDLWLRIANPGSLVDGYKVRIDPRLAPAIDRFYVQRSDNGVITDLGAYFEQNYAAGDAWGGEMISSTLTVEWRTGGVWSAVGTRTDATYASGYIGIRPVTSSFYGDNFGGGEVVAAGGWGGLLSDQRNRLIGA